MLKKILYPNGFSFKFNKKFTSKLSTEPGIDSIVKKYNICKILEIGSWHGKSAITFARELKKNKKDFQIVCVDTWLGSYEYWTTYKDRLLLVENSFKTFCSNVVKHNFKNKILPFRQTSTNAFKIFKFYNIKFDLIYWDGDHSMIYNDLVSSKDILSSDGIIVVDDYFQHVTVKEQTDNFIKINYFIKEIINDKIIIRKS